MNDTSELKHGKRLIKEELESRLVEETDLLPLWDRFTSGFFPDGIANPIFACCFSEKQNPLSQWRSYAGSSGFALQFDSKKLQCIATKSGFTLGKCIYEESIQRKFIRKRVHKCIKHYRSIIKAGEPNHLNAAHQAEPGFYHVYKRWARLSSTLHMKKSKSGV